MYVRLFAVPWTVTCQAPQSMEFSRQKYWSGWPFALPVSLMNIDMKIFNKIKYNDIKKEFYTLTTWDLSHIYKAGYKFENQLL